eukprot:3940435-Rhodomonas_salina.1
MDGLKEIGDEEVEDEKEVVLANTPRNRIQETAVSVQFVPAMRFLVFDFEVYVNVFGSEGAGRGWGD